MTAPRQPDYRALLTRSLLAVEQLEERLAAAERARAEPIAVVGMACRFPAGANDLARYWDLLSNGRDGVTVVPADRWDAEASFDSDPDVIGKSYTRWGGFIDQVTDFDAGFFGIAPREAISLDPQHRLLLEVTWEALEHACIAPSSLNGSSASVFVGISTRDYATMVSEHDGGARLGDAYTASGTAHSIASGRISYFLGLQGPNFAVDTACSSSMVAVHNAIASLRNDETNLAIAGGVSLMLSDHGAILTSRARMMSFDGRCKTFDTSADGYVRGEGCGMLVLKRLSHAKRDGNRIFALIRGSAINQDGRSSGLTAPNGLAQEAVIRSALVNARLRPEDIDVVEAHGTGTPLGDPIEMKALGSVFAERSSERPLLVGSVKTNIGHLEAASGVASIIKIVLAMQHGMLPPHLHFRNPNVLIPWSSLPVRVPTAPTPWPSQRGQPRRAGVSSFGFSGTNAHVILEAPPPLEPQSERVQREQLLVLSTQTESSLRVLARDYQQLILSPQAPALADVARTAARGRSHLNERLAIVAMDGADAAAQLERFATDPAHSGSIAGRAASGVPGEIAFMFSGQGTQYPGMTRELYETESVFREALERCAAIANRRLPLPLLPIVLGEGGNSALLNDTAYTQPALFAVEYSLVQLWKAWGVEPAVVMGHSVGEYVAACVAGVFSLQDGLGLLTERARLMSALPRDGAMVAVFAPPERVRQVLAQFDRDVAIAAVNGPANVVISGRRTAIDRIVAALAADAVDCVPLNVSHAFHSPLMDPMLDQFERYAESVTFSMPRIGLVSNVTGKLAGAEVTTGAYWRRHARDAVLFADSIAFLHGEKIRTFMEIGPMPVLIAMGKRCPRASEAVWIPSIQQARGDRRSLLESAARLHVDGQAIQWEAVTDANAHHTELPAYPFERKRYWLDLTHSRPSSGFGGVRTGHPLLGERLASSLPVFQTTLSMATTSWLADHRIHDNALLPLAAFVEIALAAAHEALADDQVSLEDLSVLARLVVPEHDAVILQVVVIPHADAHTVQIFSRSNSCVEAKPGDDWILHLTAKATRSPARAPFAGLRVVPPHGLSTHDPAVYYDRLRMQGAQYGIAFRILTSIASAPGQVLGRIQLQDGADTAGYLLHPTMLDAALQLIGVALHWDDDICLPVGLSRYQVYRPGAADVWCHVHSIRTNAGNRSIVSDMVLTDGAGEVVATIDGIEMQRTSRGAMQKAPQKDQLPEWLLQVDWQALPTPERAHTERGDWLLVSNDAFEANALALALSECGVRPFVAMHDESPRPYDAGWSGDLSQPSFLASIIAPDADNSHPWQGVVYMVSADARPVDDDTGELSRHHALQIGGLIEAVPSIANTNARFYVLTRGAQAVEGSIPNLSDAPLAGFANVIAAEYPALRTVRIDLDPAKGRNDLGLLAATLLADDDEGRVALRGSTRYGARLRQGTLQTKSQEPTRLEITERGTLSNLALVPFVQSPPCPGEIEIRVHAAGLNFRDVLNALGMYPGDPPPLGNECAGVVSAVGDGVIDFAVGDEVVSMVGRSFATTVLASTNQTVKKPANLTFAEAATIPVAFLTAEYGLAFLAGIKAGDKVLIHAVTGGVGMAALQIARRAGAIIFGTAGSGAKRALALELGVHHVSDSRSLKFVDEFRDVVGFDGFDVVINSLAGDFIPASLGLLKPRGHFVEIGRTSIWDATAVEQVHPGAQYHPLFLGDVTESRPLFMRDMLQGLMKDFAHEILTPLPLALFPIEKAESAFRFMSQGVHTGKIVLEQPRTPTVRSDATYLITGGVGALGLLSAQWLSDMGARHLLLLGRSEPDAAARESIDRMRADGTTVETMTCDIANEKDVLRAMQFIESSMPPLRGVLHAAGVVDDALIPEQSLARFNRVMRPKMQGSWFLHRHTRHHSLDFFVMYSSGASLLGSPAQSNYAAANSFMDALAHVRRADGLPAVSINWGSWASIGMAANVDKLHHRRWAAAGLETIHPAQGLFMLKEILTGSREATVAALPLSRSRLSASMGPFFRRLIVNQSARVSAAFKATDTLPTLKAAAPEMRFGILSAFLVDQVMHVLALPPANRVRIDQSLMDIGMDSLTAMELRNRVLSALQVRLTVGELLQGPTIEQLTASVLEKLDLAGAPSQALTAPDPVWEEGSL